MPYGKDINRPGCSGRTQCRPEITRSGAPTEGRPYTKPPIHPTRFSHIAQNPGSGLLSAHAGQSSTGMLIAQAGRRFAGKPGTKRTKAQQTSKPHKTPNGQTGPALPALHMMAGGRYVVHIGDYDWSETGLHQALEGAMRTLQKQVKNHRRFRHALVIIEHNRTVTKEDLEGILNNLRDKFPSRVLNYHYYRNSKYKTPRLNIVFSTKPFYKVSPAQKIKKGKYDRAMSNITDNMDNSCHLPLSKNLSEIEKRIRIWKEKQKIKSESLASIKNITWKIEKNNLAINITPKNNVHLDDFLGSFDKLKQNIQEMPCPQRGNITITVAIPEWQEHLKNDNQLTIKNTLSSVFKHQGVKVEVIMKPDPNLRLSVDLSSNTIMSGIMKGVDVEAVQSMERIDMAEVKEFLMDYKQKVLKNSRRFEDYQALIVYERPLDYKDGMLEGISASVFHSHLDNYMKDIEKYELLRDINGSRLFPPIFLTHTTISGNGRLKHIWQEPDSIIDRPYITILLIPKSLDIQQGYRRLFPHDGVIDFEKFSDLSRTLFKKRVSEARSKKAIKLLDYLYYQARKGELWKYLANGEVDTPQKASGQKGR